ncbi:MAG: hypothetical protein QM803_07625 [Rhodocyclaceae bacterium]
MRHRMSLSYEALAEGLSADDLVGRIQKSVAPPDRQQLRQVA